MSEFEEFVILLHRHPELIDQLRQLAEAGASQSRQNDECAPGREVKA